MTELQVVDLGNFPVDEATPVVAGPRGQDGASAYEVAVANGFVGTEAEWLASLGGGPGGGAVDSVNGQVGAVVLDAADVGADPAGTAAAASTADRARANHTGTQTSATIADFTEAVQDAVAALLTSGTNVTLTYDDTANTLTVASASGGDVETIRDTIGAALVGVGNVAVTVNDAADTITISTTATVNSTDAALRDRSTHTGTQSADTLTDGTTNKAFLATERTKLAGVATGATANDTDANLKNRANHTGSQTSATISDLAETVQDLVAAMVVAGTNVTKTYDDTAGTLTLAASGGSSSAVYLARAAKTADSSYTGTAWSDVDSATLILTVVVPSNGEVEWGAYGAMYNSGSQTGWGYLGLRNAGTFVEGSSAQIAFGPLSPNGPSARTYRFIETGLTPGATVTRKLAFRTDSSVNFVVGGGAGTTASPAAPLAFYAKRT